MEFVSDGSLGLTGYAPNDLTGDGGISYSELICPDDREEVWQTVQSRLEDRQPFELTYRIVPKEGRLKWVWEQGRGVFADDGSLVALEGFITDITKSKKIEETLRENDRNLWTLMDALPVAVTYADLKGNLQYCNRKQVELFGYTIDEIPTVAEWRRKAYPDEAYRSTVPALLPAILEACEQGKEATPTTEATVTCRDGSTRRVTMSGTLVSDRILVVFNDVTERKKAEDELQQKTAFLEAMVHSSPDGILVIDSRKQVVLQNQRYVQMRRLPPEIANERDDAVRLRYITDKLRHPERFSERVEYLYAHPTESGRDEIEEKDGSFLERYSSPVLDSDGTYYGRIWTFRDITGLKRHQAFLENLSVTDSLTGISNRRRFDEFLDREWAHAMRSRTSLSLVLMDIDFFKAYNDNYGHLAGDDCLRQLAACLSGTVRRSLDLAARYGGEEFACVLPDTDARGALCFANKIREEVKRLNIHHSFSSAARQVTMSMGVATIIPQHGQTSSDLIQVADELLYAAKQNGRNQVRGKLEG
jgi:diguanylate cyclase (GGDEF)-like protein/PAS domain S-box-containing protein